MGQNLIISLVAKIEKGRLQPEMFYFSGKHKTYNVTHENATMYLK